MKLRLLIGVICLMILSTVPVFSAGHEKDIVDTAVEAGSFKTLVEAVKAAGLVDTLKGKGPFKSSPRRIKPLPSFRPGP